MPRLLSLTIHISPTIDVTFAPNFDPMSQFNGNRVNPADRGFNRGRGG